VDKEDREDRFYDMFELRMAGWTCDQIGKRFGLCKQRVYDILAVGIRKHGLHRGLDVILGVQVSRCLDRAIRPRVVRRVS